MKKSKASGQRLTYLGMLIGTISFAGCAANQLGGLNESKILEEVRIDPFAFGDEFSMSNTTPVIVSSSADSKEPSPSAPPIKPSATVQGAAGVGTVQQLSGTTSSYRVQISIHRDRDGAEKTAMEVRTLIQNPVLVEYKTPFFRVLTGALGSQQESEAIVKRLKANGFSDALWIAVSASQ